MINQPVNKIKIFHDTTGDQERYYVDILSDEMTTEGASIAVAATKENAQRQAIRRIESLLLKLKKDFYS